MTIPFTDFAKLELLVSEIKAAEPILGANKLYKLTVDIGSETRQLVAGIAQYYSTEQLIGKKIIVLANLEPRAIRGLVSQGMLLAADSPDVSLLTIDKEAPLGTRVSAIGKCSTIKYDDFTKIELIVGKIESAEYLKDNEHEMRISVDLGNEKRQLIQSISNYYSPERLVGKTVVVFANLEPRKVRGHDTSGTILLAYPPLDSAANGFIDIRRHVDYPLTNEGIALLTVDKDVPPGTKVR